MVNFSFIHIITFVVLIGNYSVFALPPSEEISEEVLTTEIMIPEESVIDNPSLTTVEDILLKEKISKNTFPPQIDSSLRHKIFLLKIRKMIRTIFPFNN